MKSPTYIFAILFTLVLSSSCEKENECGDVSDILDGYLIELAYYESLYELTPTGSNGIKLRDFILSYLDYLNSIPAKCASEYELTISNTQNELKQLENKIYQDNFWLTWQCSIQVPSDYNHDKQVSKFYEYTIGSSQFSFFQPNIYNDNNWKNTTDKLVAGKTYKMYFYELLNNVSVNDCIGFMENTGGLFTSEQGLTLGVMTRPSCFVFSTILSARDILLFAPDYAESLPKTNDGRSLLPIVQSKFASSNNFEFHFTWYDFNNIRRKGEYLVVYYE